MRSTESQGFIHYFWRVSRPRRSGGLSVAEARRDYAAAKRAAKARTSGG